MKKYNSGKIRSVSCGFYDQLEAFAVRKLKSVIRYRDESGDQELEGIITDIFVRDHREYLMVDGEKEVGLDSLISVNGIPAEMM
jgi:transcriptional antiterminator Rof (Rho-off)